MGPFDPVALVVMLETFYPRVTRANLERAYEERREYFGGGRLIGRLSDALLLPDARIFDIVFAAWTPRSKWQALDVTHAEPSEPDEFALEPGPLEYVDVDRVFVRDGTETFEAAAGAALVELGASEAHYDQAINELAAAVDQGEIDAEYDETVGGAAERLAADVTAVEELAGTELLEESDGLALETSDRRGEFSSDPYTEDAPVIRPDPKPPREGDDGRPGKDDTL